MKKAKVKTHAWCLEIQNVPPGVQFALEGRHNYWGLWSHLDLVRQWQYNMESPTNPFEIGDTDKIGGLQFDKNKMRSPKWRAKTTQHQNLVKISFRVVQCTHVQQSCLVVGVRFEYFRVIRDSIERPICVNSNGPGRSQACHFCVKSPRHVVETWLPSTCVQYNSLLYCKLGQEQNYLVFTSADFKKGEEYWWGLPAPKCHSQMHQKLCPHSAYSWWCRPWLFEACLQ